MKQPNRAQRRKQARLTTLKAQRCALEELAFQAGYQEGYLAGKASATRVDVSDDPHIFLDRPSGVTRRVMFTPAAAQKKNIFDPIDSYGMAPQTTVTLHLERKAVEIDGYLIEWADWKVGRIDRSGYDPRMYR